MQSQGFDAWLERIDWPVAIRGAGTGFGVLVLSVLLMVLFGTLGYPWALAALWVGWPLGFILSARRSGSAPSPVLTGAVAAFFAYTLTLPLMYMSRSAFNIAGVVGTLAAGVLIGAATGWYMGRRQVDAK